MESSADWSEAYQAMWKGEAADFLNQLRLLSGNYLMASGGDPSPHCGDSLTSPGLSATTKGSDNIPYCILKMDKFLD
ncbi:Hypothetical predicted protein, partial [Pelobates cultripes]